MDVQMVKRDGQAAATGITDQKLSGEWDDRD